MSRSLPQFPALQYRLQQVQGTLDLEALTFCQCERLSGPPAASPLRLCCRHARSRDRRRVHDHSGGVFGQTGLVVGGVLRNVAEVTVLGFRDKVGVTVAHHDRLLGYRDAGLTSTQRALNE